MPEVGKTTDVQVTATFDWGLSGWTKVAANFGAIGIVCGLLIWVLSEVLHSHREAMGMIQGQMHEMNRSLDKVVREMESIKRAAWQAAYPGKKE